MRRPHQLIFTIVALVAAVTLATVERRPGHVSVPALTQSQDAIGKTNTLPAFLPYEARVVLRRIAVNGPFPHDQDGGVFGNREHLLPSRPPGYYREYTVETPGIGYRGARRIITGGRPPIVYYYTDDHYRSFRSFDIPRR
ncbi:MAG: ribonuclease domain-containing protein [Rhodanobacteraceae bacterium]